MNIKYDINLSLAANTDLDDIFAYIADASPSGEAAKNLMQEIHEAILSLSEMPHRFSRSPDPTLADKGYRRVGVKKYIVLYLIDEEAKTVNIARVFHSNRDFGKYI